MTITTEDQIKQMWCGKVLIKKPKKYKKPAHYVPPKDKNIKTVLDEIKASFTINRKELIVITKLSPGCMTRVINYLLKAELILKIVPTDDNPYGIANYEVNGNK